MSGRDDDQAFSLLHLHVCPHDPQCELRHAIIAPVGGAFRVVCACGDATFIDSAEPDLILEMAGVQESPDGKILCWPWSSAPWVLRAMSTHGGDEDWVMLVPRTIEMPSWASRGTSFGVFDVSTVRIGGWTLAIGAHA